MQPLITPIAMRAMEQRYFAETGTPSIDLMETAARALCDAILRRFGANIRVFIACGPGGNGGDGYACARMLKAAGCDCALFPAEPPRSPDAACNRERALAAGVPELALSDAPQAPDLWVDALYGTGLSRAPEGMAAALIERMDADGAQGSRIVAVDIPSGLNGMTGAAFEPCVRADFTLTFQFAKTGHFLADGLDVCGEIEVADIGIPVAFHPADMPRLMEPSDALAALPAKPRNAHKGKNGHLLVVAGSVGMAGAAALCAMSALRSGAGLVTVACPESIVPILQTLAPCAMAVPLPERDGAIAPGAAEVLAALLPGKSAAVCGNCSSCRRMQHHALPGRLQKDRQDAGAAFAGQREYAPVHTQRPKVPAAVQFRDSREADSLFDALVDLRRSLAAHAGLPPYIVCSDLALRNMEQALPLNAQELAEIDGMGYAKARAYGTPLLDCIRRWITYHEEREGSVSPDMQEQILVLRKSGCGAREIAEQTGLPLLLAAREIMIVESKPMTAPKVREKQTEVRVKQPSPAVRKRDWYPKEINWLRSLHEKKWTVHAIARQLGRKDMEIVEQLHLLGLKPKYDLPDEPAADEADLPDRE